MSKRRDRRDAGKEAFWQRVIEEQSASGSSVRAFCRERELSDASFYYWRKELRRRREEMSSHDARDGGEVVMAAPTFAEVHLADGPEVEITRGETTIRIRGGCDAMLLRDAVRVLKDASC